MFIAPILSISKAPQNQAIVLYFRNKYLGDSVTIKKWRCKKFFNALDMKLSIPTYISPLRNLMNFFGGRRGGKKSPNPLAHPNPLTNYPIKLTYLINWQMSASPIRPN